MRVGIKPDGRAPAREGTEIRSAEGAPIGKVTSGGFGPSVNGPISMGYVAKEFAAPGTKVQLIVRDKPMPARHRRAAVRAASLCSLLTGEGK